MDISSMMAGSMKAMIEAQGGEELILGVGPKVFRGKVANKAPAETFTFKAGGVDVIIAYAAVSFIIRASQPGAERVQ